MSLKKSDMSDSPNNPPVESDRQTAIEREVRELRVVLRRIHNLMWWFVVISLGVIAPILLSHYLGPFLLEYLKIYLVLGGVIAAAYGVRWLLPLAAAELSRSRASEAHSSSAVDSLVRSTDSPRGA